MKIDQITLLSGGTIVTKVDYSEIDIEFAMASDLMSDVLTLDTEDTMLISGLANLQTIRTAEMQDVLCILLARNKKATIEMIEIAEQNGITIIESPYAMYRISGILFVNGIRAHY